MLAPDRRARIRPLLQDVSELPPGDRAAYLTRACADAPDVRAEVESLLRARDDAEGFLDPPEDAPVPVASIEPAPALEPGTRLGAFEIVAPLGAGGMGQVYRARDTRLGRTVAIKVVAPELAGDPGSEARFEREARALSALNHPHICVLHDVGRAERADGREQLFLVMELVEGETLAARLKRGPLPLDRVLSHATQIAEALDAAHRQGVVHRDLKPANVMLTKTGVKLLDFGLARLRQTAGRAGTGDVTSTLTRRGMVAGTLPYMAPEQVRGEEADARSDLFAFGAVLYEMVAGRRAFDADSPAALMAQILERDPPALKERAPVVPAALDRLIRTCLAKDPPDRWQHAHDVVLALCELKTFDDVGPVRSKPRRWASLAGWAAAAVLCLVAGWFLGRGSVAPSRTALPRTLMSDASPVGAGYIHGPRISPDGRMVAFLDHTPGKRGRLFIYDLGTGQTREIAGRPSAFYRLSANAWSSDGRTMLYKDWNQVRGIDISSGTDRLLGETTVASLPHGGVTQGPTGTILVGDRTLRRLARNDRTLLDVYRPDSRVRFQAWPALLPNGRDFVFTQYGESAELSGIFLGSLDSDQTARLHTVPSNAAVSRSGHLIFGRDGSLLAQRLDLDRRAPVGEPAVLARRVEGAFGIWAFSVGPDDSLVYAPRHDRPSSRLVWYDRTGAPLGSFGEPRRDGQIALARDGRHLAFGMTLPRAQRPGLGFFDLVRGTWLNANVNLELPGAIGITDVVWSPDGRQIAFSNWGEQDSVDIYITGLRSTDKPEKVENVPGMQWVEQWSPDGRMLLYRQVDSATRVSVWALPLEGDRTPFVLLDAPFEHGQPQVSPDSQWLAYVSNEEGRFDVYVQRFREPSERLRVSPDGGGQPKWRDDGSELFYVGLDGTMMSVAVTSEGEFGEPQPLFRARLDNDPAQDKYAIASDGQRFLMITPEESNESARIVVLTNWQEKLRE